MFFLLLLVIFAGVATACWFQGLWSCALHVIFITLSGLVATNYYEPLSDWIASMNVDKAIYFLDFLLLWVLFASTYGLLRLIAKLCSTYEVVFIKPVDLAGRSILAIWCGWVFTCFASFTLLTAPLPAQPLGMWSTPNDKSFLFMSPEQQWLAFMQSRSYGALSRNKFSTAVTHPLDAQSDVETFDPVADFTIRSYIRRSLADAALNAK